MRKAETSRVLALGLRLLPFSVIALAAAASWAQDAAKPFVRISPVILAEPEVETPLAIQVTPETLVPRQSFIRIRGLPASAKLSDGHVITPGAWAVPLTALATLKVMAPISGSGRTELTVALVSVDGGVLAESKSSLVVAPAWLLGSSSAKLETTARAVPGKQPDLPAASSRLNGPAPVTSAPPPPAAAAPVAPPPAPIPPPPAPAAVPAPPAPAVRAEPAPVAPSPPPAVIAALPPPPAVAPPAARSAPPPVVASPAPPAKAAPVPAPSSPPVLSREDRERAERMVQRGEGFLGQGNLAAARQFFRRAADMGLAAGAMRLAATFDPVELAALQVAGLKPEPAEARKWYERARELGAAEAGARISRLEGR